MVRLKNRYLMTEVVWLENGKSTPLSEKWLFGFIAGQTKDIIGELTFEAFKKTLKFIYVNPDTNLFIIRVSFEYYKSLWTSLSMITSYYNVPIYFRTVHVGGSIKCCQKAAIKLFGKSISIYDKNQILNNNNNNNGGEPTIMKDSDDEGQDDDQNDDDDDDIMGD